ncbi:MAG TPA: hypothetical protein VFZ25_02945 [Chloroflexota bacterium]|nr:hypothetical protein [Chloroflexota bacterium]
MLTLTNDQLAVSVLDPVADRARLGSRYCTGGYVYAVADQRRGMITSGPGYPSEEQPPLFDGQGLPEAFPSQLWVGKDPNGPPMALPAPGTTMLVIGVGLVRATPMEKIREMPVDEFCEWQTSSSPTSLRMETTQSYAGWQFELTRELRLANRTLVSETRLTNTGADAVSFRWFPHPFFPLPKGECCKFNCSVSMPENPGYEMLASGFVGTKTDHEWSRAGHFQALEHQAAHPLITLQRHPTLGLIAASCSYVPTFFPIWGNRNTFSFEPYLSQAVAPGAESTWAITYDF